MRKLLLIMAIFSALIVTAQRQDFHTWWSVNIEGEMFNRIDYEISPEIRLFQNSTSLKSGLIDVDLSSPITKNIRIGGKYRFQSKYYYNNENYLANRFNVYGQFSYKIKRFRLKYRAMYQWEYFGLNTREYGDIPFQEHRHKLTVSYYRKRWALRPVIAGELFFLHKPDFVVRERKYRLSAGLSYRITESLNAGLHYKYQYEFFANNPWKIHILSTRIGISF